MAGSSGSKGRPGVPTWARGAADWLFGAKDPSTGFMGDATAGQGGVDFASILGNMMPSLNAANRGGAVQRDMASGLTNQAVGNTMGIADQSNAERWQQQNLQSQMPGMLGGAQGAIGSGINTIGTGINTMGQTQGGLDQQARMASLMPQMFQAATDFAGNINQGEDVYNKTLPSAYQSLSNVMNPTQYNPLYQNAMRNEIAPTINAQFSGRGLGSSGAPIAATTAAGSALADQFAQRQFQEQMGAQQNLTGIGNALTNSGVQAAQIPGQVLNQFMNAGAQAALTPAQIAGQYGQLGGQMGQMANQIGNTANQFMNAQGQAQQNLGLAAQNQMAPLGALGAGSQQFWQGVNAPIGVNQAVYDASRAPMANLLSGVTGVTGGISAPQIGPLGKMLGK